MAIEFDDYRQVFISDAALMDLRAPAEFAKGAFPTAISLPLMTDAERAKVGTCYKQQGQQAAINLGHKLVSGEIKAERLGRWCEFAQKHPQGYLYCWRGGLRSQITQSWMQEAGVSYPRIKGGYKALRQFLLNELELQVAKQHIILLAGRTGSGKTLLLQELGNAVDLESLARHRGSSFGAGLIPQPTQISFENQLAISLLKLGEKATQTTIMEDECGHIGSLMLPLSLREKMALAPVIILDSSLDERVECIFDEYIQQRFAASLAHYADDAFAQFSAYLQGSLFRIRRRLGGEAYQQLNTLMQQALVQQANTGDADLHRVWITRLLRDYYDPMYDYQLSKRPRQILFRGNALQLKAWLAAQTH
ncbi:tRNA 2-selenouridine(34) synthase MnmH [Bowmanella sp. Y26]|uniref:tRNA 2-selenouridine(34) synthase MnmH n=1 Tax=Bowmanella yangjiangensis TaxID=2811230 RepID=UPI001BDDC70A|nr:tRNA 2-selenouridine(34) synthase MnmH [Bowmanella yangjiangensis]MBT1064519.1 tRNA 2-selenouridine(34) synthase MnmH [Bowmanella yangjiangensis]